jgi:hypothetical protein
MPFTKTDGTTKWVSYEDYVEDTKELQDKIEELQRLLYEIMISTNDPNIIDLAAKEASRG